MDFGAGIARVQGEGSTQQLAALSTWWMTTALSIASRCSVGSREITEVPAPLNGQPPPAAIANAECWHSGVGIRTASARAFFEYLTGLGAGSHHQEEFQPAWQRLEMDASAWLWQPDKSNHMEALRGQMHKELMAELFVTLAEAGRWVEGLGRA